MRRRDDVYQDIQSLTPSPRPPPPLPTLRRGLGSPYRPCADGGAGGNGAGVLINAGFNRLTKAIIDFNATDRRSWRNWLNEDTQMAKVREHENYPKRGPRLACF
ncbi:MAG: hypothetical protein MN733_18180 [Nitrososphaera sp.]|nr:hypothetical protein [Nitrososphaera sp.]